MSADKDAVLARLQAANAEFERDKDAARWRWIRDSASTVDMSIFANAPPAALDAYIDDCMEAKEQ